MVVLLLRVDHRQHLQISLLEIDGFAAAATQIFEARAAVVVAGVGKKNKGGEMNRMRMLCTWQC